MAQKLIVEILGDSKSLESALRRSSGAAGSFGSSIAKVGKVAALAAGAAGIGALVVTLKSGYDEWTSSTKVAAQTEAVIKSTGSSANVTAKQVDDLASSLLDKTGVDDEVIKSGENMLLTFTNIHNEAGKGNDIFTQSTKTLLDMSVALGEDMPKAAIQLGKALNDPVKGVGALSRVGVTFTEGQKKTIKALVDGGHTMEAQKIILKELTKEFGGSAVAIGKTLPGQINIAKQKFANFAGDLVGKLVPAFLGVTHWFGRVGEEFSKARTFSAKIKVVWTNIKETAVDLANRLADYFWRGWTEQIQGQQGGGQGGLIAVHAGLLAGLATVNWSDIGRQILDGIVAGLKDVARIATALSDVIKSTVAQIDWTEVGVTIGPALAAAVVVAFTTLTDPSFWANHWSLALAVAVTAFPIGKLGGLAAKLGTEMGLVALRGVERFSATLAKGILDGMLLAGRVLDKLGGILAPILNRMGTLLEGIVRRIFGKLGSLAVFVVKVLGIQAVINALAGLAVSAYNKAKAIGQAIIDAIKKVLSKIGGVVANSFVGLYNAVTEAATLAATDAVSIGTGIISGIISGLGGLISRVANAIKDKVTSAISDAWNFLTGSPEVTAAIPIGTGVMLAVSKGIRDEVGHVASTLEGAMGSVFTDAASGITAGFATVTKSMKAGVDTLLAGLKAQLATARGGVKDAFASFVSAATSAFDTAGGGSPATRRLAAKLKREQDAQAAKAAAEADAQRKQALADAQASGDPAAIAAAEKAIADAKEQAKIDTDAKALEEAKKRDKDAFEKQLAALEAQANSAKTAEQLARIKAKIKALLAQYGITPDTVQAGSDWQTAQSLFVGALGDLKKSLDNLRDALNNIRSKGLATPTTPIRNIGGKAAGGGIPGFGSGDIVPAWLEPGEYVVRKAMVQRYGRGFMDMVNAGRFQSGGPVDPATGIPWELPLTSAVGSGPAYEIWRQMVKVAKYNKKVARVMASRALYNPSMLPTPASRADSTIDDWLTALSTDRLFSERLNALKAFVDSGDAYRGGAVSRSWLTYGVPKLATGGTITRSGLAYVHRGETVTPAARSGGPLVGELHVHNEVDEAHLVSKIGRAVYMLGIPT